MMMYAVYYNFSLADSYFMSSLQQPCPIDPKLLSIKVGIDNAIMKYLGTSRGMADDDIPHIDLTHSSYPMLTDRFMRDANIVSQIGSYFFVLSPLLSFTIVLNEIIREKELRLRQVRISTLVNFNIGS